MVQNGRSILFYSVVAIFVATAVVTLLGVINVLEIEDQYLQVLFAVLIIELGVAVVGLFKATDWFGASDAGAVEEIAGDWWQFLRHGGENVVGLVHISYEEPERQLKLQGRAFTPQGREYAQFWSVAASLNAVRLDLYYFWQGDHSASDEDFSGVGFIRFSRHRDTKQADEATGWFTKGDIFQANVAEKKKVEYRRASNQELSEMAPDKDPLLKETLVRSVYGEWASRSRRNTAEPGGEG